MTKGCLEATLEDGRVIAVPLSFYPTLVGMTPAKRRALVLTPRGAAIEWPDIDFGISIESMVAGGREHVPPPGVLERIKRDLEEAQAAIAKSHRRRAA